MVGVGVQPAHRHVGGFGVHLDEVPQHGGGIGQVDGAIPPARLPWRVVKGDVLRRDAQSCHCSVQLLVTVGDEVRHRPAVVLVGGAADVIPRRAHTATASVRVVDDLHVVPRPDLVLDQRSHAQDVVVSVGDVEHHALARLVPPARSQPGWRLRSLRSPRP